MNPSRERFELGLFEARSVTGRDFVEERDCAGNLTGYLKFYNATSNGEKPNVTVIPREQVYFDSTHLQEAELFKAHVVAMEQNDLVLAIFRRKRRALTPWEVWQEGVQNGRQWLITSVRRSMSVLSAGGAPAIVKLDSLRMGPHGKPSHEWCLPEGQP